MIIIYLSLLAALILINRYLFGSAIKPNDIFNIIWCVFGGLASMGILGFYPTSYYVNTLVLVAVLFFNLSYLFFVSIKNRRKRTPPLLGSPLSYLDNTNINLKLLVGANGVCWLISLPLLARSLRVLFTEGFDAIRKYTYSYGGEAVIAGTNVQLFFTWIVQPVFAATMVLAALSLVLSLDHKKLLLSISGVDMVLYTLLFGGRGTVLKFVSFLVISILVVSGKKLINFIIKHKGIILLLFALFAVIVVLITARSFKGMSVMKNIYAYVAGPFVFLDKVLEAHPLSQTPRLWGAATVGCLSSLVGIVGKVFLGIDFTAPENSIPSITAPYLNVGPDIKFNSMTTMIYPFLLDFGYLGLVICPCIFGCFVALMEKSFYRKKSLGSMGLYVYVFHTVVFSVQNYTYFKLEALSIIMFIILFTISVSVKNGKMTVR